MDLTYVDLLSRLTDMERLSLAPVDGERAGCVSSYDRHSRYDPDTDTYRDWDANDDGGGFEREVEGGGVVALELKGPGVIWRSWSAMPDKGHVRVFVDGELIIDEPFIRYLTGFGTDFAPLNVPDVCPHISRGYNRFLPIPFQRDIRIEFAEGWGRYYHFTYSVFGGDVALPRYDELFRRPARVALAKLDRMLHLRAMHGFSPEVSRQVGAGARAELLNAPGQGAIERMQLRLSDPSAAGRLLLRIYWDGEARPSVCAPVCDLFGTSGEMNPFATWVSGYAGGALYMRWHMPFAQGARVELENLGGAAVGVEASFAMAECQDAAQRLRFCAKFHRDDWAGLDEARFAPGGDRWPDWPVLRAAGGAGRFVGMHLRIQDSWVYPDRMQRDDWWFGYDGCERLDWWWGEGDEKFFVDGEKHPSTFGTGSEDYIGYAWAAEPPFALFDSPFAANAAMPLDGNGLTSVCRFHVCDNVPFQDRFEAFIEKYKGNAWGESGENKCLYGATAFWYQQGGAQDQYAAPTLRELEALA